MACVKKTSALVVVLLAVAVFALPARAGLITTTFASNNQFEGNMFDATIFGSALKVTALDVNIAGSAGQAFNIDVYTKSGTYVGFETTPGAWTLVASGSGTSAGQDQPSNVDISDFILSANAVTGMYVTLSPAVGFGANTLMRYTNGSNTFANADLQLDLGKGVGGLFGANGGIFNPRTWNGTIYYDVESSAVPEPSFLAVWTAVGAIGGVVARRKMRKRVA